MTSTFTCTYSPTLTGALAQAHIEDLLRDARRSRAAAHAAQPDPAPHAAAPAGLVAARHRPRPPRRLIQIRQPSPNDHGSVIVGGRPR